MNENLSHLDGHGGQIDVMAAVFPDAPLPWIDLSTGINPFPYPLPRIPEEAWTRLPTARDREKCETAMAEAFDCDREYCRAVPGTELVIRQLPAILSAEYVIVRGRSYADHAESWGAAGASVKAVNDPLDHRSDADVVVLVNPNNPDGTRWPIERIEEARSELASQGGWLIVDEAYADLEPALSVSPMAGRKGLIVLRSFGKFFGLAGVRLGAVLGPSEILSELADKFGGWDVSGPALSLGAHAYADFDWQNATRLKLSASRGELSRLLAKAEIEEMGGTDLFRFVRVPDAKEVWEELANKGIAVRQFAEENQHLRIGIPHSDALMRLSEAFSL
ncbi:MAG: threonine-phosphate decarboxylase CobD [Pseudomonadota bacterium]